MTIYSVLVMKLLPFLLCLLPLCKAECPVRNDKLTASVTVNSTTGEFTIHDSRRPDAIAWGQFQDDIFTNGWTYLQVETDERASDSRQAYAAGLVEGYLTQDLIRKQWNNRIQGYCNGEEAFCEKLMKFLKKNFDYMYANIEAHRATDPYWHQVALVLEQLNGLDDSYNNITSQPRTEVNLTGLLWMNLLGDIEDLEQVLQKGKPSRVLGSGSCSALVKLLPSEGHQGFYSDLYSAQDTWSSYDSMLRVLKRYRMPVHLTPSRGSHVVPGHTAAMSSYPATLSSNDDYYLLSSGLTVMETTIGNGNPDLWKYVTPTGTVMYWIRNIVANRIATSGEEWTKVFSQFNSGTYNNQWMVVDYKRFRPYRPLQNGLLWVLEQLPKVIESADLTEVMAAQGYWPSYNTPYFPMIFNLSGVPAMVKKYGDWFTYDKTPRALIFKRDHGKVHDISSMIKLMRYNNFREDPLSSCNCTPPYSGENAISARSDLNPANGTYPFSALGHRPHGGTDMKMTSFSMFQSLLFVAVGGPTYDSVEPFQWSKSNFSEVQRHEGHPDLWKFDPILHIWE